VCLLPAAPKNTRAAARVVTRLREEGGHGEMLRTHLTDSKQQAAVIDATSASGRTSTASWWRARAGSTRSSSSSAAAAVASCEEALAEFESEALSAELDERMPDTHPGLHAVEGGND
jgi:hypothetical protein